jgi:hypothetical protein
MQELENESIWFCPRMGVVVIGLFVMVFCCPGGAGLVSTPRGRKNRCVHQDLHEMQDKSVANQITTAIKSAVPEPTEALRRSRSTHGAGST